MALELFPQDVRLYPDDRQLFTARVSPGPIKTPYWYVDPISSPGFVRPDFSIQKSTITFTTIFGGLGALALITGLGSIEYTVNQNCLPNAPGNYFEFSIFFVAPGAGAKTYIVTINPTDIEIGSEGGLIATLPITAAAGDIFRIELGAGFRLSINGILRHERVTGLTPLIAYPATYFASIEGGTLTAPPIIPAPRLSGDWRLIGSHPGIPGSLVQFLTPAHGSISQPSGSLTAEYFDGTIPGQYKLVAFIDPGSNIWVEDAAPAGSSVTTGGGVWAWGTGSPAHFSGTARLKSPNPGAAEAFYFFDNATATLQINKGDVLSCYVFIDATNPCTEILLQFKATDATALEHRAYWGANSIPNGVDGTPSRRFMGSLPATNQWVEL